jgi:cytochrome c peroxidase
VQYRDNIDRQVPFDRHPGDQPALTESDIQNIVAFLNTLTDGYGP